MDSFDFDNLKAEKTRAMQRIFAEFLVKLDGVVESPLFVFLLRNAIIATLLVKSGQLTAEKSGYGNVVSEIYEEIAKRIEDRQKSFPEDDDSVNASVDETVYQDKGIVSEINAAIDLESEQDLASDLDSGSDSMNAYRRSKPEMFVRKVAESRSSFLRKRKNEEKSKLRFATTKSTRSVISKLEELANSGVAIPVGIAGPLLVNGRQYFVPMATIVRRRRRRRRRNGSKCNPMWLLSKASGSKSKPHQRHVSD